MTKVLDQLWGGAIRPCDRVVRRGTEYDRLQEAAGKAYDRFWNTLTTEQKEAFTVFTDLEMQKSCISDADIFTKGFRLGVQLVLAAVCEDDTQLPQLEEA